MVLFPKKMCDVFIIWNLVVHFLIMAYIPKNASSKSINKTIDISLNIQSWYNQISIIENVFHGE